MKIRTRYAPSPTGKMHVGNLRSALYEFLIAKHAGGDFMLRIEDTDQERFVEGATEIIYRTLEKTGLKHDEGPDKQILVAPCNKNGFPESAQSRFLYQSFLAKSSSSKASLIGAPAGTIGNTLSSS